MYLFIIPLIYLLYLGWIPGIEPGGGKPLLFLIFFNLISRQWLPYTLLVHFFFRFITENGNCPALVVCKIAVVGAVMDLNPIQAIVITIIKSHAVAVRVAVKTNIVSSHTSINFNETFFFHTPFSYLWAHFQMEDDTKVQYSVIQTKFLGNYFLIFCIWGIKKRSQTDL